MSEPVTTCPRCRGVRIVELDAEHNITCPTCKGRGYITPDDTLRGELTLPADVRLAMTPEPHSALWMLLGLLIGIAAFGGSVWAIVVVWRFLGHAP